MARLLVLLLFITGCRFATDECIKSKNMLSELFSTLDRNGHFAYLKSDTLNILSIETKSLLFHGDVLVISDSLILHKVEHVRQDGDYIYNNYISLNIHKCVSDTLAVVIWHHTHLLQKLPVGVDHGWYSEEFIFKVDSCELQLVSSTVW